MLADGTDVSQAISTNNLKHSHSSKEPWIMAQSLVSASCPPSTHESISHLDASLIGCRVFGIFSQKLSRSGSFIGDFSDRCRAAIVVAVRRKLRPAVQSLKGEKWVLTAPDFTSCLYPHEREMSVLQEDEIVALGAYPGKSAARLLSNKSKNLKQNDMTT